MKRKQRHTVGKRFVVADFSTSSYLYGTEAFDDAAAVTLESVSGAVSRTPVTCYAVHRHDRVNSYEGVSDERHFLFIINAE
ncbi:MAG: hypothetical protein NZ585_03640 [Chloracidobacterium sp.]|nr:hypothetical protein [Chloracidobacterium sp.]MDW8217163.1 hypothetical protein [Acidobacteriota bacterium]